MNNYIINFDYLKKHLAAPPLYWRQPIIFKPANLYNNHKPIDSIGKSYIQPNIYRKSISIYFQVTSIEMHK